MNNLEEILYQKHISKAELARQLNVSPQRVNNWTQDKNYPQRKYMRLMSIYLNIPIEKLFFNGD